MSCRECLSLESSAYRSATRSPHSSVWFKLGLTIKGEVNHANSQAVKAHSAGVGAVREQSIIQTKIVLLIALPAFARKVIIKVIIVDLQEMSPGHLLGLAAIALVLGVIYWLMPDG